VKKKKRKARIIIGVASGVSSIVVLIGRRAWKDMQLIDSIRSLFREDSFADAEFEEELRKAQEELERIQAEAMADEMEINELTPVRNKRIDLRKIRIRFRRSH
jgi:predicted  nucleic acid-binding Zn-ribbon protein